MERSSFISDVSDCRPPKFILNELRYRCFTVVIPEAAMKHKRFYRVSPTGNYMHKINHRIMDNI